MKENFPENIKSPHSQKNIYMRIIAGGIVGGLLFFCLFWVWAYIMRRTPDHLNPYIQGLPLMVSILVAWFGTVIGALLSLFSKKWKKDRGE